MRESPLPCVCLHARSLTVLADSCSSPGPQILRAELVLGVHRDGTIPHNPVSTVSANRFMLFLLLTGSMRAGAKADLDVLSRSPVSRLDGTPGWLPPHHLPVPTRPNAAQAVSQSGTKCFPTALTCLGKRRALCVCTCSKHTSVTRMCAHIAMRPYTCCGHAGGRSNSHIINLSSNGSRSSEEFASCWST